MNKWMKAVLAVLVLMYAVSPDPMPGPIDDLLIALIGWVVSSKLSAKN